MKFRWLGTFAMAIIAVSVGYVSTAVLAAPPDSAVAADPAAVETDDAHRVSVDVARDRARLMHEIYASTLEVMHHRYFHGGRSIVPARAMEDVFSDLQQRTKVEARWISVNLKAMSINHKPDTEFEKRAAKEIAEGESEVEMVEDGFYRRVGAIPMSSGCVSCHDGFFKKQTDEAKFAGLVISIPVLAAPQGVK